MAVRWSLKIVAIIAICVFGVLVGLGWQRAVDTWRLDLGNSLVSKAMAQAGCVPNPNDNGPPFSNGCSVTARGLNLLANAVGIGLPQVATLAKLQALSPGSFTFVARLGYNAIGDVPQLLYTLQNSACLVNGGAGDNGAQVLASGGGKCWIASFGSDPADVREWGAFGDGSTDVTNAVQLAVNDMPNGGTLLFPSAGASYVFSGGINVAPGRSLTIQGASLYVAPLTPFDNTESDWTGLGTWFKCSSTTTPCWAFQNNGFTFAGINFWQTQPTPTHQTQCPNPCSMTTGFTATTYAPLIYINGTATSGTTGLANYWTISDVRAANCMSSPGCIEIVGNNGSGSASSVSPHLYSHIDHTYIGNLGVGLYEQFEDNDIVLNDVKFELPWENYSSDVLNWTEGNSTNAGHKIDESWNYVAGQVQVGVEHDFSAIGIEAQNGSITEPFGVLQIGAQAVVLMGENFNEVCRAIYTPPTSGSPSNPTLFQAQIEGGVISTDFVTSPVAGQCANGTGAPWAIDVQSDQTLLVIGGLQVFDTQGILAVGAGSLGNVTWHNANSLSYSNYTNGGNAFKAAAGAKLIIGDLDQVKTMNSNAGTKIATSTTLGPMVAGGGISIDGLTNTVRALNWTHNQTNCSISGCNSVEDWSLQEDSANNWSIFRYSSTGGFVDAPLGIAASNGQLSINDGYLLGLFAISGLPSCATSAGLHLHISNGIAAPTYQQTVSTTGSTEQPVYCNGTNWVYD